VSGDAVDIGPSDARAWLSEHGAEYGLCQIYRNEPWHYELRPEAIDDGCPPMYADPTHDPRMRQADGSRVDAVRNLDKGSPYPYELGKNPGSSFIDAPGDGGFATAPDLVRFAHALRDGTVLDRHYAELLTGAKIPHLKPQEGQEPAPYPSFEAYGMPVKLINGQWVIGRGGANPGSGANWNIYPDTGWVGVILSNYDNLPLQEIGERENQAITGQR
jgi:CubicO group peptidase (beta-lactamase class C family)